MRRYKYIGVADNDPKAEIGGTLFYAVFNDGTKETRVEWSIMDELNNNNAYKKYLTEAIYYDAETLRLEEIHQKELKEVKKQSEKNKLSAIEEKLKDPSSHIHKDLIIIMDAIIQNPKFNAMIQDHLNGNEKAINAVVGNCIKEAKSSNILNFDPVIIKSYILNKVKQ